MVTLALEIIPLVLQRARTRAISFFGISFLVTHTHTHTQPQTQTQTQTDGHTNTVVNLKLEQYET